jgi:uncharacterized membrane protein
MKMKLNDQDKYDRMRTDPDNYKWGIFYYNPSDPRILLPKRNMYLGWTLNFANPLSYCFILVVIAFGLIIDRIFG